MHPELSEPEALTEPAPFTLTTESIEAGLVKIPQLASLRSINRALSALVRAEHGVSSQIAEIIRRDPSLTSRLLKLVNSVFFGLDREVTNIEEAVLYLGLRQIRELATATPVIEELQQLTDNLQGGNWRTIWQHSLGTAIMTRELLALADIPYEDDTDYIMGLVHNIGKIALAHLHPEAFAAVITEQTQSLEESHLIERRLLGGFDHGKIGGMFLSRHGMSPEVVAATIYHCAPEEAPQEFSRSAAAVHMADHLVRTIGLHGLETISPHKPEDAVSLASWKILFGDDAQGSTLLMASIQYSLTRLPMLLSEML